MLARLILIAVLLAVGGSSRRGVLGAVEVAGRDAEGLRRLAGRFRLAAAVGGVETSGVDCGPANCDKRRQARLAQEEEDDAVAERVDQEDQGEVRGVAEEEEEDGDDGAAVEEGRGRGGGYGGGGGGKKKKGYGKMLMVLGGLTKAVMLYIMIHAVALLAGKALIVAKVALAIATALALKKSVDHKTSYEIVKHPHYSHVHTQSSSVDYDHGAGGGSYEGGSRRRRRARR